VRSVGSVVRWLEEHSFTAGFAVIEVEDERIETAAVKGVHSGSICMWSEVAAGRVAAEEELGIDTVGTPRAVEALLMLWRDLIDIDIVLSLSEEG
jgi:hypothetical protein